MYWGPGTRKDVQKSKNTPTFRSSLNEPQTEKENRFFFQFQADDLLNTRMVWIAL